MRDVENRKIQFFSFDKALGHFDTLSMRRPNNGTARCSLNSLNLWDSSANATAVRFVTIETWGSFGRQYTT
ncbi:hypothetical protein GCM10007394_00300 [Salinibacterium amurskyense]|nr:hypothetical protein GCM10007394_00300 [Salinibacterium amurskyense]